MQDLSPRIGRETKVGDLTVRASSVDVRTVGAGGGSIAHVPELTKALRVGPQSAGADPGPAAYGKGGTEPTVTDANVVLGYLPTSLAGGEITLDVEAARAAVGKVAEAMGLESPEAAAAGIVDIVNENMLGGLRLVSVQQGFDPRDFALVAFGGAGPLHANALGVLTGAWPVIVPPSPGVLCALGDATTSRRDESARTVLRRFAQLDGRRARADAARARRRGRAAAGRPGAAARPADGRLPGRRPLPRAGLRDPGRRRRPRRPTWPALGERFDAEHDRLFSFLLDVDHELVNARATVTGPKPDVAPVHLDGGRRRPGRRPRAGALDLRRRRARARRRLRPGEAAGRRRGARSGDRHRDGLHDPRPARARGHRAPLGLPADHPLGGLSAWHGSSRPRPAPIEKGEVDPVTLDLIENGLRNARYEMDEVLFRTALSPGIREQHDEFPLIADPDGKMVVGQFGLSIPDFLDGFDDTIEEGDVLLTSDPYACGAAISHANDWLVVVPIFQEGRVVGWAAMFGHMSDVGGKTPSSMPTDARTIFEEGVVIPPFKLYREGRAERRRAADRAQPGAQARLEPRRPQRPGRRLPHRRAAGWWRCATGSAPAPTCRRWTRCCSATTTR